MKKRTVLYLISILLCLVILIGYRIAEGFFSDNEAPKITMDESIPEVSVSASDEILLQGISAWDDHDGDVTASLLVESIRLADSDGTVTVTCAAFDRAGNVTKATRNVRFTDYEGPKFSLSKSLTFVAGREQDILGIVSAWDALDGDISHRVRATSLSDSALTAAGIHDVEFRVTNSLGDTARLVLPIEVFTTNTYDATLTLTDYLVYLDAGESFFPNNYLDQFIRGIEATSFRTGTPSGFSVQVTGQVDTNTPGVYSVTYKVTQTLDNARRYSGYARMTVVVEG